MGWFGDLSLAWKYGMVFGILLAATLLAGLAKVLYNRNKLKKLTAAKDTESAVKEEHVELNAREKDEGDLFGVRAIEAGYTGGVHQSRPNSACSMREAKSFGGSSTALGSFMTPKLQAGSATSSVMSLPLGNARNPSTEAIELIGGTPKSRPSMLKLQPSEAELSGRIRHDPAVNMQLNVPPSPVHPRSPTFGGSEDDNDRTQSPPGTSPRSPTFPCDERPGHYVPSRGPALTVEDPTIAVRNVPSPANPASKVKSAAASVISGNTSPAPSMTAAPGPPPQAYMEHRPSFSREEGRSIFPSRPSYDRPSSRGRAEWRLPKEDGQNDRQIPSALSRRPSSPTDPAVSAHTRDTSGASSLYSIERSLDRPASPNRLSVNFSHPRPQSSHSSDPSPNTSNQHSRNPSTTNSLSPSINTAGSASEATDEDPRFSSVYDAYYRRSRLSIAKTAEVQKRPAQLNLAKQRTSTINEMPSPLPSPLPGARGPLDLDFGVAR